MDTVGTDNEVSLVFFSISEGDLANFRIDMVYFAREFQNARSPFSFLC